MEDPINSINNHVLNLQTKPRRSVTGLVGTWPACLFMKGGMENKNKCIAHFLF
jgi:hypothetical protein